MSSFGLDWFLRKFEILSKMKITCPSASTKKNQSVMYSDFAKQHRLKQVLPKSAITISTYRESLYIQLKDKNKLP
jgi:hypothetical protein